MIEQLVKAPPIGEARDRELLKDAHSFIYFSSPGGDLAAHFFFPPQHDARRASAPVVLFLHGGMWDLSMPTQFVPHCLHFANRGAVTLSVEYRVRNSGGTPLDALEDAAMALVFLKKNARILGIDAERIVLSGAGSGAHLALCCATLPRIGCEPGERFRPAALFLFSPIVNTTAKGGTGTERFASEKEARECSPSEFLPQKRLPPCLLFHAQQDRLVPLEQITKFVKRYRRKRNRCELMEFRSVGHTFFNYNSHQENYEITVHAADHFLVDLGILEPDPFEGEF